MSGSNHNQSNQSNSHGVPPSSAAPPTYRHAPLPTHPYAAAPPNLPQQTNYRGATSAPPFSLRPPGASSTFPVYDRAPESYSALNMHPIESSGTPHDGRQSSQASLALRPHSSGAPHHTSAGSHFPGPPAPADTTVSHMHQNPRGPPVAQRVPPNHQYIHLSSASHLPGGTHPQPTPLSSLALEFGRDPFTKPLSKAYTFPLNRGGRRNQTGSKRPGDSETRVQLPKLNTAMRGNAAPCTPRSLARGLPPVSPSLIPANPHRRTEEWLSEVERAGTPARIKQEEQPDSMPPVRPAQGPDNSGRRPKGKAPYLFDTCRFCQVWKATVEHVETDVGEDGEPFTRTLRICKACRKDKAYQKSRIITFGPPPPSAPGPSGA